MGNDGRDDDPDRAAILKRRSRFVALALSGMATVGCGGDDASTMPCLNQSQVETSGEESGTGDEIEGVDDGAGEDEPDTPPDAEPVPCLSIEQSDD